MPICIPVSLSILVNKLINLDEFTLRWSGPRRDHMVVFATEKVRLRTPRWVLNFLSIFGFTLITVCQ